MMIGLIDVDGHHFPNLALMKLSAWHKERGDSVEWYDMTRTHYDRVYMAKVFSDTYTPEHPEPWQADEILRGGSGYAIRWENGKEVYHKELDPELPEEIEHHYPDYSLYPEYTGWGKPIKSQTAFGFLTRGCPRGCAFCHVAPKEGRCSRKVAELSEFWNGQGNICLSDPNILACRDAPELLQELSETGAKVEFNQGLDARLIRTETAEMLAKIDVRKIHFAMDRMQDVEQVTNGLLLYRKAYEEVKGKKWDTFRNAKVFVLVNFDTTFEEDLRRVMLLRDLMYQPYVMIYNKSSAAPIYRRLSRWTNDAHLWATADTFRAYQEYAVSIHQYRNVIEY